MGRMGPVEKHHCLTALLKLQVERSLSPCSSAVGGWMDCACHSLALRSPARLLWGCAALMAQAGHLPSALVALCSCLYPIFPEGAVPAEVHTLHLLQPHSSVSVQEQLPAVPRGEERNSHLSLQGRVKDSRSQKRRCIFSPSLACWSHGKACITLSSPQRPSLAQCSCSCHSARAEARPTAFSQSCLCSPDKHLGHWLLGGLSTVLYISLWRGH